MKFNDVSYLFYSLYRRHFSIARSRSYLALVGQTGHGEFCSFAACRNKSTVVNLGKFEWMLQGIMFPVGVFIISSINMQLS